LLFYSIIIIIIIINKNALFIKNQYYISLAIIYYRITI